MTNPFESIEQRLNQFESILLTIQSAMKQAPAPIAPKKETLFIEDFEREFRIPIPTIRRHAKRIGFTKFGRRLIFKRADILTWLAAHEHKGRAAIQQQAIDRLKAS